MSRNQTITTIQCNSAWVVALSVVLLMGSLRGLAYADSGHAALSSPSSPSAPPQPALAAPPEMSQPQTPSPSPEPRDPGDALNPTVSPALQARRDAYAFQAGEVCPFCGASAEFPNGRTGLHWHDHWQKVGTREYITTPVLLAAGLGLQFVPEPKSPGWDSPILFDTAFRNWLRLDSRKARSNAETISDALFVWEMAHPMVLDPLIAWGRQSPEVAWQMAVINAQSYGLTLVLNQATKLLAARKRPYVDQCNADSTGASCSSGSRHSSFYSGHSAMTATSAGLLCAHHTQLHLYGSDLLDTGTCVTAVLGSAVTGALRIASDNHWASDVVVGHLMGYVSGYLLPTLLYYKEFRLTAEPEHSDVQVAALPVVSDNSFQLLLFGTL